jgi:hypothetical protein
MNFAKPTARMSSIVATFAVTISIATGPILPAAELAAVQDSVASPAAIAEDNQSQPDHECAIDLAKPGMMKDIVSNALLQGLHVPEQDVQRFLVDAQERYESGGALLRAAAAHFQLEEATLAAEVERFKHVNCGQTPIAGTGAGGAPDPHPEVIEVSAFAKDVTLHVVLHEIGHALIREFDIPILGNEETAAEAFATYYLTTYLPDRAVDVLSARTKSLMIEAGETPQVDWTGEHDDDARRAFQIAALAVAADPVKYQRVADIVGMSEEDISDAQDYGAEIRRSWRRVLGPLWMTDGTLSNEARVLYEADNALLAALCLDESGGSGLAAEIEAAIQRFDWHSQVTVHFVEGSGGAGWSRSSRTITVQSEYVLRFIEQGQRAPGTAGLQSQSN